MQILCKKKEKKKKIQSVDFFPQMGKFLRWVNTATATVTWNNP